MKNQIVRMRFPFACLLVIVTLLMMHACNAPGPSLQDSDSSSVEFDYPRDTSYSIQSAFDQIRKSYPFVRPIGQDATLRVAAMWNVKYKQVKGRSLHMDIFYPLEKNLRSPGVLMIHGGGWSSGSRSHQIPMAQALAQSGYVAAAVEYRLSPEAVYPAGVLDLQDAIVWLRSQQEALGLDGSRIATLGCSAGATLASLLGTAPGLYDTRKKDKQMIQAVINIDGVVSFLHPEASPEWTGGAANRWLGSYGPNNQNWKEASALEYVSTESPPFLFVNSAQPRFHAGRDSLIHLLQDYEIFHQVHTIEDSPHSFWLVHPWYEETLDQVLGFLKVVFDF